MANLESKDTSPTSNPAPSRRDILAAGRTAMAAGRSYATWTGTGLSLIGFGFTIYRFLISLQVKLFKFDPVEVGLFIIGIGTATMLYGASEYWKTMSELHRDYGVRFRKTALLFGLLTAGFGTVLFFTIVIRTM